MVDVVVRFIDGGSTRVLRAVLSIELFLHLSVSSLVGSGISDELIDLFLSEVALVALHDDSLFVAIGSVSSRNVKDAVSINVKGNFNLRDASLSFIDALQVELGEEGVILNETTLSFVNRETDSSLIILGGSESLGGSNGNSSVSGNEVGHHSTSSLYSDGEGSHINRDEVLNKLVFTR